MVNPGPPPIRRYRCRPDLLSRFSAPLFLTKTKKTMMFSPASFENWGPCEAPNCMYHSPRCEDSYCGACCQRSHEGPSSHYHPARRIDPDRVGFKVNTWKVPPTPIPPVTTTIVRTPATVTPTPTDLMSDEETLLPITNNGYMGTRGRDGDFDLLTFFDAETGG